MVDELFLDAEDELMSILGRDVTYEEIMDFMDAKITGVEDFFIENVKRREK